METYWSKYITKWLRGCRCGFVSWGETSANIFVPLSLIFLIKNALICLIGTRCNMYQVHTFFICCINWYKTKVYLAVCTPKVYCCRIEMLKRRVSGEWIPRETNDSNKININVNVNYKLSRQMVQNVARSPPRWCNLSIQSPCWKPKGCPWSN